MFCKKFLTLLLLFAVFFSLKGAPDTSTWTKGPSKQWHLTLESAQELAARGNKKIYVLFTGSDWCGFCIKLKKEVLNSGRFKSYARNNLELVYIDFPRKKNAMPDAQRQYNTALRQRLGGGGGVPSALILDSTGRVLGKVSGYRPLKKYMEAVQKPLPVANTSFHQRPRQPAAPAGPSVPPAGWHSSLEKALEKSKAENKKVLVLRTGSDWCPPCMRLEREALNNPEFKEFAAKHLELVFLDSPRRKTISSEQRAYNVKTAQALNMGRGVPSLAIVDTDSKVTARQMGYGSFSRFMEFLKKGVSSSVEAPPLRPVSRPAPIAPEKLKKIKVQIVNWDSDRAAALAGEGGIPGAWEQGKRFYVRLKYDLPEGVGGRFLIRSSVPGMGSILSPAVSDRGETAAGGVFHRPGHCTGINVLFWGNGAGGHVTAASIPCSIEIK